MRIRKLLLGLIAITLIAPVSLTACEERTEVEIDRDVNDTAPVIVPDRDIDVNVETQPAPNVIERETNTNTTIEKDSTTGDSSVTTEKKTTVR